MVYSVEHEQATVHYGHDDATHAYGGVLLVLKKNRTNTTSAKRGGF